MSGETHAEQMERVFARIEGRIEQLGLTEREASMQATGKPDLIRDMRRRQGLPRGDRLQRLARVLGTTSDWLLDGGAFEAALPGGTADVQDTGLSDAEAQAALGDPRSRLPRLPLVGSAIGGAFDEAEHVELTELVLGDVLDHLPRPEKLAGDRRAYALTIVGESMAPRFEPGEVALVSPQQPVAIGDDVIVQLRSQAGDDADPDHANRVTMVLIKRLVRRTARELTLRQFNPETTFTVPIGQVAATHKVVGRV